MHLILNGEKHTDLTEGLSVSGLLAHLGLVPKKIAVERNLEIVPKSRYDDVILKDGDTLEIITFIGGG